MKDHLVIGSRGSKLALTQAGMIKAELETLNPSIDIRIEIITTSGDVKTDPLSIIGGKGVFTKELEEALLDGRIDIAVHSLKDLPTIIPARLAIPAICKREDPRDALVLSGKLKNSNASLEALPKARLWELRAHADWPSCSTCAVIWLLWSFAGMSILVCASWMKDNMMRWYLRARDFAASDWSSGSALPYRQVKCSQQ